ncbi:MAG: hypothetical protein C7B45_16790, partial [Sulfobacillus acidophilus]
VTIILTPNPKMYILNKNSGLALAAILLVEPPDHRRAAGRADAGVVVACWVKFWDHDCLRN